MKFYAPNRVPNAWEIEALMQVKRMVRSLFSVANVELMWEPDINQYAIGVSYDYNIAHRLPQQYFGIPVRQYDAPPLAYTKGSGRWPTSSITYGPQPPRLNRGWGIGWPETLVQGGGVEYGSNQYYCQPPGYLPQSKSGMLPPPGGSYCGRGC